MELSDLLQILIVALISAFGAATGAVWKSWRKDIERLSEDIKDLRRARHEHNNQLQRILATLEFIDADVKELMNRRKDGARSKSD